MPFKLINHFNQSRQFWWNFQFPRTNGVSFSWSIEGLLVYQSSYIPISNFHDFLFSYFSTAWLWSPLVAVFFSHSRIKQTILKSHLLVSFQIQIGAKWMMGWAASSKTLILDSILTSVQILNDLSKYSPFLSFLDKELSTITLPIFVAISWSLRRLVGVQANWQHKYTWACVWLTGYLMLTFLTYTNHHKSTSWFQWQGNRDDGNWLAAAFIHLHNYWFADVVLESC